MCQVVRLCKEHGLYSALIYLYNRGLDDFISPLEELLTVAEQASNLSQIQLVGFVSAPRSLSDHICVIDVSLLYLTFFMEDANGCFEQSTLGHTSIQFHFTFCVVDIIKSVLL